MPRKTAADITPINPAIHISEEYSYKRNARDRAARKVRWSVDDFRVTIEPQNIYNNMTAPERLGLFNRIVAQVRVRSEHPQKFYSAALAITESGQMFVTHNTQRQHEFHKDCAEINLVNVVSQLAGSKDKIDKLYLMVGFDTPDKDTPADKLELPYVPCGKCMDTLCKCSLSEATITVLPPNDGQLTLTINNHAHHIEELKRGEAWETRLSNLMVDDVLPLGEKEKAYGEAGWDKLTDGNPLPRALPRQEIEHIMHTRKNGLTTEQLALKRVIRQTIVNTLAGRTSEPALDADASPESINRFMVNAITRVYKEYPKARKGQSNAESVRCVVLRLANGTFHCVTEVDGPQENAVPHAEISAVAASQHQLQPVTDVWVMRVNRQDIAEGIMRTSPKEALERVFKRRPSDDEVKDAQGKPIKGTVNMHYMPFNDGTLSREQVEESMVHYPIEVLFVSRFRGARFYGQQRAGAGQDRTLH